MQYCRPDKFFFCPVLDAHYGASRSGQKRIIVLTKMHCSLNKNAILSVGQTRENFTARENFVQPTVLRLSGHLSGLQYCMFNFEMQ